MVSTDLSARALRVAPTATFILLAVWTFVEILRAPDPRWVGSLLSIFVFGLAVLGLATAFGWAWIRPFGLACIAASYFVVHAFVVGVSVGLDLAYLTLAIASVELRILAERFAPLYETRLDASERKRIRGALTHAVLRLLVASILAVFVPILAADLALAGIVPATTIPSAILLAAALVAVVVAIALLPIFERRAA